MSPLDDADVVSLVLSGDRDAYATLVARHEKAVRAVLWRLTGNAAETDELSQAVFCRAYFALATFDPRWPFRSWIQRIAHNLCVNHLRRARRELELDGMVDEEGEPTAEALLADSQAPDPEQRAEQSDSAARVRAALSLLPADYRRILVMRFLQDLSHEEIMAHTGLPLGTVKSRLSRARQQLVKVMVEGGEVAGMGRVGQGSGLPPLR